MKLSIQNNAAIWFQGKKFKCTYQRMQISKEYPAISLPMRDYLYGTSGILGYMMELFFKIIKGFLLSRSYCLYTISEIFLAEDLLDSRHFKY
jgi:hypothetical protein